MNIEDIQDAVRNGRYRVTNHAREEARDDRITVRELVDSVLSGEIIEEYLDDRPHPSCLIYGRTSEAEPVHGVWAYDAEMSLAILVTIYRPDPAPWIDWQIRRPKDDGSE